MGSACSRGVEQLLFLGDADGHEVRQAELRRALRTPPTAVPCRRRSRSGRETVRLARAASGSGAARLRAWPRSRRVARRSVARDSLARARSLNPVFRARVPASHGYATSHEPRTQAPNPKLPILPSPHPAVLAHHHRRHGLAALNRRDVEALDAARQRRQREDGLQRLERVVLRRGRLVEARAVRERGVARRQIHQAALLAALRHDDAHAAAGTSTTATSRALRARPARTARESRAAPFAARRTAACAAARTSPSVRSDDRLLAAQLDPLDDASAADLKHLDRPRPAGPA